ncbi:large-conductance mechanosensitive channel protein MscL [Legionella taurinensis]|uniref:Large-conductance mechanosensitive channel n=1 Tax=Legionella taurinensis TaxID=70611 RepID=A0A3A5LSC3_9GAMM|nr:large-conductance mechanosensitive channel protein MscL [Legionella taurinensis]MDX1836591.1 large-conductance mechanosensitive channel protein MscL [Legionella taurinensis]PUT42948.1 large conductance mechanosensitive channel protein MscL [Legionella taurinensis]PUT45503.1 large conductance mechanosensitive channel protein MscL [Legionella taurinensis]PUT46922.1 large conductance mechanosensitive channel protein MscL [Legionella taurinensis]PUT49270.1 large conductance mechanosensitive cha
MRFFSEFKEFAMRGNVVDLAVAVIIGAAFGKIVSSLVDGIIMPLIGLLLGGVNVANKSFQIGDAVLKWGAFLQTVIDFTLIAFAIFVVIKLINLLQKKKDEAPEKLSREAAILIEIRDLLSQKGTRSAD